MQTTEVEKMYEIIMGVNSCHIKKSEDDSCHTEKRKKPIVSERPAAVGARSSIVCGGSIALPAAVITGHVHSRDLRF